MQNLIYRNIYISFLILVLGALVSFSIFAFNNVNAQTASIDSIKYPVEQLGNCENEEKCRLYCDGLDHINECISFAEKYNLMTKQEAEEARHFARAGIKRGPGECGTQVQCRAYCEDIDNINECLAFAEKHNVLSDDELKEAKQVAEALKSGAKLPGGCANKETCEAYCSVASHMEECITFAEAAGFMDPKELEEAKKIIPLMKSGQMPGGCTSKKQCEKYCEDENNFGECLVFAEKAGFISPEEAEMVRKTGGRGPGNCKGKDECEAYCSSENHMEECMAFAQKHGLISDEEISRMKEGMGQLQNVLKEATPEVVKCLEQNIDDDIISKIQSGVFSPRADIGDKVKSCFENFMPMPDFPPEAKKCISEAYGEDAMEKITKGEIRHDEIEHKIGPCMEEIMRENFTPQPNRESGNDFEKFEEDDFRGFEEEIKDIENEFENIENINRDDAFNKVPDSMFNLSFPPQAEECLVRMYGSDYKEKLLSGMINPVEINNAVQSCIEENIRLQQFQTSAVLESLKIFLRLKTR